MSELLQPAGGDPGAGRYSIAERISRWFADHFDELGRPRKADHEDYT